MYNVTFETVHNNHDRLRDDTIIGWCVDLPKVGEQFCMATPPRDAGGCRLLTTNYVTKVKKEGAIYTFKTSSGSIYRVTRN